MLPGVFAGRSLGFAVTGLAWPIIAENLFQSALTLIDLLLVARLGAIAVAGVGVATQMVWLGLSAASAVSVGATILIAHAIGRGDRPAANHVARQAILLALALGAVVALLTPLSGRIVAILGAEPVVAQIGADYLGVLMVSFTLPIMMFVIGACMRGAGDSRTPMWVGGAMNIVHAAAAYLLIFGVGDWAGLGAIGSAWAAVIARGLGCVALLALLLRRRSPITIAGWTGWRPDAGMMVRLLRLGVPASLEQVIISGGFLVYSAMVIPLGTAVFAAQRVTFTLISLSFMPGMGYGMAATTLTGQALGAQRPDLARRSSYIALTQAAILMSLAGVVLFAGGDLLMRPFTDDPAIIGLGAEALRVLAVSQPFWALAQVMAGSLRGGGDTRFPMLTALLGMWALRLPVGYAIGILAGYGLAGVYVSSVVDAAWRGFVNLWRFRRAAWLAPVPAQPPVVPAIAVVKPD